MKNLIALIKQFEGLRLKAYLCPAKVWTIGYGATGKGIGPGLVWTREQAEARLESDAHYFMSEAKRLCPKLSGEKLEAIADFAYNLGSSKLASSTLRKRINSGELLSASEELGKWVFSGGVKLNGLIRRRAAEKALFLR